MVYASEKGDQNKSRGSDIMKAPNKPATIFQGVEDPTRAFFGQARGRVAEVMATEPIPGRITASAGGVAQRVRKTAGRLVLYEKRGSLGVITAKVQNVGEVYDEIDALLDAIEKDGDIRAVAIYTLNGLFASLPIR
jgi:hypothetical protein